MNKISHYNVNNICKLRGARLRNSSYDLGETDNVFSRVLWNPHWMESADTYLVTVKSTAPRSGLIIICSPQTANIMWENHFQLQETNL